ncbi:MAG: ASKHA domain-containing protein [Roseburia sp.]
MDEEQTIRIGLFPEQFRGHITMIGNSALAGAQRYLLDDRTAAKQRLASITGHAQELSLAMHPKFNELYLDEMFFDTDRDGRNR